VCCRCSPTSRRRAAGEEERVSGRGEMRKARSQERKGSTTHKVGGEVVRVHVEAVVDDGDVDALADDALVPHARHVDRVLADGAVDEVPLLGPQRVDNAEPGRHRLDIVVPGADDRRDGGELVGVLSAVEVDEGAARELGEDALVRREDGEVALGALARVLALERADEAVVRRRGRGRALGVQVRARRARQRSPQEVVTLEDLVALALGELLDRPPLHRALALAAVERRRREPAVVAGVDLVDRRAHEVVALELADLLDMLCTEGVRDILGRPALGLVCGAAAGEGELGRVEFDDVVDVRVVVALGGLELGVCASRCAGEHEGEGAQGEGAPRSELAAGGGAWRRAPCSRGCRGHGGLAELGEDRGRAGT